jgi:tRNA (uracil-5-)-methyltransferase
VPKSEPAETTTTEATPATAAPTRRAAEFTSEIFKIQIRNLPRYSTTKDVKKLVLKFGVTPVKVKKGQMWEHAFVTFSNDEDREQAIAKLNGQFRSSFMLRSLV